MTFSSTSTSGPRPVADLLIARASLLLDVARVRPYLLALAPASAMISFVFSESCVPARRVLGRLRLVSARGIWRSCRPRARALGRVDGVSTLWRCPAPRDAREATCDLHRDEPNTSRPDHHPTVGETMKEPQPPFLPRDGVSIRGRRRSGRTRREEARLGRRAEPLDPGSRAISGWGDRLVPLPKTLPMPTRRYGRGPSPTRARSRARVSAGSAAAIQREETGRLPIGKVSFLVPFGDRASEIERAEHGEDNACSVAPNPARIGTGSRGQGEDQGPRVQHDCEPPDMNMMIGGPRLCGEESYGQRTSA